MSMKPQYFSNRIIIKFEQMKLMMSAPQSEQDCLQCPSYAANTLGQPSSLADPIILTSSEPISYQSLPHLSQFSNNLTDQYYVNHFQPRSDNQVRQTYYQKLMRCGMLLDKPKKKCHHIVILDWDDTLLCTSHLNMNQITQIEQMSMIDRERLSELDSKSAHILRTATELAKVYIVTNSIIGWVQYSAKKFMPITHTIIETYQIQVISARTKYAEYVNIEQWKTEVFKDILTNLNHSHAVLNLLCIGDSQYEMDAAETVSQIFDDRFIKTIKLRKQPRLEQLNKELQLVDNKLSEVIRVPKTLNIRLEARRQV